MCQTLYNRYLTHNTWWSLFSNVTLSLLMHLILTPLPISSMLACFTDEVLMFRQVNYPKTKILIFSFE